MFLHNYVLHNNILKVIIVIITAGFRSFARPFPLVKVHKNFILNKNRLRDITQKRCVGLLEIVTTATTGAENAFH